LNSALYDRIDFDWFSLISLIDIEHRGEKKTTPPHIFVIRFVMPFSLLSIFLLLSLVNQVFSSPVLLWSNVNLPQATVHFGAVSSMNFIDDAICAIDQKKIQLRLIAVQDVRRIRARERCFIL